MTNGGQGNRIGVRAVVEDAQFQEGLQRYLAGLDESSKGAAQMIAASEGMVTATDQAGEAFDKSGESAVTTAARLEVLEKQFEAVKEIASTGLELAELGAQSERVEARFEAFAERAGGAEEMLLAFQRGAGGTVSEMQAMTSATQLLQMGLVNNSGEMEQLVEIATRLGDQTQDAGQRVGDFALMLANTSLPRLDAYGLSSGTVRNRIKELQEEIEGLSREEAFRIAVFEEGEKSLAVLGERVDDDAAAFERARANMENVRVELGRKLSPIFAKAADLVAMMSGEMFELVTVLGTALGVVVKFGGGVGNLTTILRTNAGQLGLTAAAAFALYEAYQAGVELMEIVDEGQEKVKESLKTWKDEAREMTESGATLNEVTAEFANRINEAKQAMDDGGLAADLLIDQQGILAESGEKVARIVEEQATSMTEAQAAIDLYNSSVESNAAQLTLVTDESRAYVEELRQIAEGSGLAALAAQEELATFVDLEAGAQRVAEAHAVNSLSLGYYSDQAEIAAAHAEELAEEQERGAAVVERGLDKFDKLADTTEEVAGKQDFLAQSTQVVADKYDMAADRGETYADKLDRIAQEEEEARQKAADLAVAYNDVAQALLDAEAADFARESLARLDEMVEKGIISEEKYAEETRELMLQFGLADEKSLLLSDALDALEKALVDGRIAEEDATEATQALFDEIDSGGDDIDGIIGQFERANVKMGETQDITDITGQKFLDFGGDVGEATGAVGDFDSETSKLPGRLEALQSAASSAGSAMGHNFADGIISSIDEVIAATQAMAQGAIDNMPSSEPKDTSSPFYRLDKRGEAVVYNFADGIIAATPYLVDVVGDVGGEVGTYLGEAIASGVSGYVDLVIAGMPDEFDKLVEVSQQLGSLGGIAADMFSQEQIEPLEESAEGLEQRLKDMRDVHKDIVKERDAALKKSKDERLSIEERTRWAQEYVRLNMAAADQAERMSGVSKQLLAVNEDLAEQQAKVEAFEAEQDKTKFLQEQMNLLEMITKEGLNSSKILQGIELGAEADPEEVMIAMTRAMADVNKRLDDQLANREELVARMEEELALAQAQAALEEAQRRQQFLQEQLDLMETIAEHGLNADDILQGFEIGADSSLLEFTEVMTRATEAMIAQMEDELETGSPSKRTQRLGYGAMEGLAVGIAEGMELPARAMMAATTAMMSAPARTAATTSSQSFYDYSRSVSVSLDGVTVARRGDENRLANTIVDVVSTRLMGTK